MWRCLLLLVACRSNPGKPAPIEPVSPQLTNGCPTGMVRVPGGTVTIEPSVEDEEDTAPPPRPVTLNAYCIDTTEVTVAAYAQCVAARSCAAMPRTIQYKEADDETITNESPLCNSTHADRDNHPINCVDWSAAKRYCEWAGKRLPSEAEWEYAARGGDGRTYPWGDQPPDRKHVNGCGAECVAAAKTFSTAMWAQLHEEDDGFSATAPVGSFPAGASPFGLLDMAGNVREWVADAERDRESESPEGLRVIRGGSWTDGDAQSLRATNRISFPPTDRNHDLGFRCVRAP
jgi:formylglycine-generating enzyme required for sulfatase activity